MKVRDGPDNGGKLIGGRGVGAGVGAGVGVGEGLGWGGLNPLGEVGPELPHPTKTTRSATTAPPRTAVFIMLALRRGLGSRESAQDATNTEAASVGLTSRFECCNHQTSPGSASRRCAGERRASRWRCTAENRHAPLIEGLRGSGHLRLARGFAGLVIRSGRANSSSMAISHVLVRLAPRPWPEPDIGGVPAADPPGSAAGSCGPSTTIPSAPA